MHAFSFLFIFLFIITIRKRAYIDKAFLFGQFLKILHWGTWLRFLILPSINLVFLSYCCFYLLFNTSLAYLFVFFGQVIHNFFLLPLTEN